MAIYYKMCLFCFQYILRRRFDFPENFILGKVNNNVAVYWGTLVGILKKGILPNTILIVVVKVFEALRGTGYAMALINDWMKQWYQLILANLIFFYSLGL